MMETVLIHGGMRVWYIYKFINRRGWQQVLQRGSQEKRVGDAEEEERIYKEV